MARLIRKAQPAITIPVKPRRDPAKVKPPNPGKLPAPPAAESGLPSGAITTKPPWAAKFSVPWESVTRWWDEVQAAGKEFDVPPVRILATIPIESEGQPDAVQKNEQNGWSYGLVQVVPYGKTWAGWHALITRLSGGQDPVRALYDPSTNLRVGAAILRAFYDEHRSWDAASSAFFTGTPDWNGRDTVNRTTGRQYQAALNGLIAEIEAASGDVAPEPPARDVVNVILGGAPTDDSYGFKHPTNLPYYAYFEGHGGQANQHTGIDASGQIGQPLYTPIDGTVVCAGTGNGLGAWSTGCSAFGDVMGHGAGRVEILAEDGKRSLILGHCSRSLVKVGQKVKAGDQVAEMGGMNGPHVHIEARTWDGRDYTIRDPREVFGGGTLYAPRVPIPQPESFDVHWTVRATRDGVPVLQRADLSAPAVRHPLAKGEEFAAVYLAIGTDGQPYWVSSLGSRIPVDGTEADELKVEAA